MKKFARQKREAAKEPRKIELRTIEIRGLAALLRDRDVIMQEILKECAGICADRKVDPARDYQLSPDGKQLLLID